MRSGIRAQLLSVFVGLVLTGAAVQVAWAITVTENKTRTVNEYAFDYPTRTFEKLVMSSSIVPTSASVTIPITIIVPVPVMNPFAAFPSEVLADPSAAVAPTLVADPVPTTVDVAQRMVSTTAPNIMIDPAAAEPDELFFETPKDYTKLAVELEMNDIAPADGGSVSAAGPAVPAIGPAVPSITPS